MKTKFLTLFLFTTVLAHAINSTTGGYTSMPVTVTGSAYDVDFTFSWSCDDYPQSSAPGRIQLYDASGNFVAQIVGSVYRGSGPSLYVSGSGSFDSVNYFMAIYAADGSPADGDLNATWHITNLAPGNYTLRLWGYTTYRVGYNATTVWTSAIFNGGSSPPPANTPPTISWNTTPGTSASGQTYTISAHGHDANGNLTQVNVWKNGQPFAFAGGANGYDNDSGNPTSDTGPQTVTFTAQAVDSTGATSAVISQTVTIAAPNNPPTISWNTTPGTVASGQTYTISAHGHDQDGNLTQVNVWKNGQPFAFAGGGNGTDGDSGNPTSDAGPQTVTFTAQAVDSNGATSAVISQTVTISAPNHAPTVSWNTTPVTVASGQSYTVSAHGHDQDGNLTQVNVWKNGQPFAFAGGGNGTDGDSGNPTSDTGPQTITFTAQAVDSNGATSGVISQTVTVAAPPPTQYTLTTSAGAGGSVSAGGTYVAGTVLTVSAYPDATHDFAGWSGDAGGLANPTAVTMDRNKSVQANFTLKSYVLTTSATAGGSVTPGGSYPAGTTVTISATPDATHYFVGWTGDAGGGATTVAITLDRSKSAQAVFSGKAAQTITFTSLGNQSTGTAPFALNASASSGLPVTFTVLSGPATFNNGLLQITGPGAVTVQASQPGDTAYLPAAPVSQTFNVTAPVALKYRGATRALLATPHTANGTPLVIQVP